VRNPYIVGSYVTGPRHYGRHKVIDYVLNNPDEAVWVVSNRRMGKTSLLRQTEILTSVADSPYVPIFWDVQGCGTAADLARELYYAFEDADRRLNALGIDVPSLEGEDVRGLLRAARRAAEQAGRKLLLLIDEAEAFLNVGRHDSQELQLLRKALQAGQGLRVIMTSTKALAEINDLCNDWPTSPFLFGFSLCSLWEMDWLSSRALICQDQGNLPIKADPEVIETICEYTNRHPYLMQVLCQRLWQEDNSLRQPTEGDLTVDDMLGSFCLIDFRHLTPTERKIVLTVSRQEMISEADLCTSVGQPLTYVQPFIYSLVKLGYLRQVYGQLAVGNHFFSAWLHDHYNDLVNETESRLTDRGVQALAVRGIGNERTYFEEQLSIQMENLQELERQKIQFGLRVPLDLVNEINITRRGIERTRQELEQLLARDAPR
jgi:hypothetical protein